MAIAQLYGFIRFAIIKYHSGFLVGFINTFQSNMEIIEDIKQAYNSWAAQYDTNKNLTRDLEAISIRQTLGNFSFNSCLEIGCGTGKNTEWLLTKTGQLTAVDFSEEMLNRAKEKVASLKVQFIQADITQPWTFVNEPFQLITFSLILEHIEDLMNIFEKASKAILPNGYLYIGELHPFKQYNGSKARFQTADGLQELICFIHHITDFTKAAQTHDFNLIEIKEFFDEDVQNALPRILTLLFKKQA